MDADELVERIHRALDNDEFEDALLLARDAVHAHPTDAEMHLVHGDVLGELGDLRRALEAYRKASSLAPRTPDTWSAVAQAHFALAEFEAAGKAARLACEQGASAEAWDLLARLAERDGRMQEAERMARKAHEFDPDRYPMPLRVSDDDFRALVSEALDEIPEDFRQALDADVVLLVEPVPSAELLAPSETSTSPDVLGLYIGVPLPERTSARGTADLPDRIYLFQRNLEHEVESREELVEQIAITLYHELGHYFGFSDEELEERDYG